MSVLRSEYWSEYIGGSFLEAVYWRECNGGSAGEGDCQTVCIISCVLERVCWREYAERCI